MLLIDADNVSIDVIEQTVHHLIAEFGALHGRRAYCNPESALKHQNTFKRLGIRPMVNLAAGKNSTDIALAVDTMELVMRERPDVLAIASSDSDFAPLVTRVREKGCRVLGFGQSGKTGDATLMLYDRFVQFSARGELMDADAPRPARKTTPRKAPAAAKALPKAAPKPVPAPKKVATPAGQTVKKVKAAAPKPTPKKAAETKVASNAPASEVVAVAQLPTPKKRTAKEGIAAQVAQVVADIIGIGQVQPHSEEVARILKAAPELADHKAHELNEVAQHLRAASILGKSQSSTKLLRKYPELFELTPSGQPNKVRLKP